jgi:hypothetical protein
MIRSIRTAALLAALPLLGGCGIKERAEAVWDNTPAVLEKLPFVGTGSQPPGGAAYPPAQQIRTIFRADQARPGCAVFAHLLIWIPAGSSGRGIAKTVEQEAMRWGADLLLIGRSRQAAKDKGLDFIYYGPEQPYDCREQWGGWKFGYSDWVSQGGWVSLGYDEWGRSETWFNVPLTVQAAFLRCQN